MEGLLLAGVRAAGYVQQADASFVAVSKRRSARSSAYALIGICKAVLGGQEGKGRLPQEPAGSGLVLLDHAGEKGWTWSSREGMNAAEVQEATCSVYSRLIIPVSQRSGREQGPRINFVVFVKIPPKSLPRIEHFSWENGNENI